MLLANIHRTISYLGLTIFATSASRGSASEYVYKDTYM